MNITEHSVKTAILIDGGYYRKRARSLFGAKNQKKVLMNLKDTVIGT